MTINATSKPKVIRLDTGPLQGAPVKDELLTPSFSTTLRPLLEELSVGSGVPKERLVEQLLPIYKEVTEEKKCRHIQCWQGWESAGRYRQELFCSVAILKLSEKLGCVIAPAHVLETQNIEPKDLFTALIRFDGGFLSRRQKEFTIDSIRRLGEKPAVIDALGGDTKEVVAKAEEIASIYFGNGGILNQQMILYESGSKAMLYLASGRNDRLLESMCMRGSKGHREQERRRVESHADSMEGFVMSPNRAEQVTSLPR
jgi:hypothetical protein